MLHSVARYRGRNRPRLQLGLGNAPPVVNLDREPPFLVLSPVACNLLHRTSELAGVSIKLLLRMYVADTKNPTAVFYVFVVFRSSQKVHIQP